MPTSSATSGEHIFTGNLYFFHAFDVGDDISLERIKSSGEFIIRPRSYSKYFKNYHIPLDVQSTDEQSYVSAKIHSFGALSFIYKIPFTDTLENVRRELDMLDNKVEQQSMLDVEVVFKKIKRHINKPHFFHTRSAYVLVQVDPQPDLDTIKLKDTYGSIIASTLRFETESLSEYQKNEILATAIGYFRGDLIVVDTDGAFVYDDEYDESLDFFEFANIQHLELRYFDRILDQQLNAVYEGRARKVPFTAYLPFVGTLAKGPIDDLGKMKVDISVITERLEGSVKLAGEPYYSELYGLLIEKRDLKNWKDAIDRKLGILQDILESLQHKTEAIREDMLTVSIIVLIFIELMIGILNYLK